LAFSDITARIVAILTARKTTLVTGLDESTLDILSSMPYPHQGNQVLFVWRQSTEELTYGNITNASGGANAHGEIDGLGTWIIGAYVRYPSDEAQAAEQLSILAWNVMTVMRGYVQDTENKYIAAFLTGSTPQAVMQGENNVWYVGEDHRLAVRWEMSF
jgi:hypothetical protein